jgi:hypothetical protein
MPAKYHGSCHYGLWHNRRLGRHILDLVRQGCAALSADASNNVDGETLHLEGTVVPNRFGGAGVFWPGGSANVYSRIDISYLGK